ncbi:MAG: ATP-dependent helicase, partial [Anaerovorax sp.]
MKKPKIIENVCFLPEGFAIDRQEVQADDAGASVETLGEKEQIFLAEYDQDKYVALYHLSFSVKEGWESPALLYLYHLANALLLALSKTPDIEWTREKTAVSITEEVRVKFKEEVPYVIGMEYVDEEWMEKIWVKLNAVFCAEIEKYQGTVEMYFTEY